jgi:hypothetical protein
VNLNVVTPPFHLQVISGTINLRGAGRVTAVLSVPAPYTLADLNITNVRFEGVPAITTALSSDGRALAATFDGSRLMQLTAGQDITVSLAANIVRNGTEDRLWVATTARVLR